MGWLLYLSGVLFVFGVIWIWNGAMERSDETTQKKEEFKVSLSTAVFSSLMSWTSVVILLIISAIGIVIYGLTESTWAKKAGKWFAQTS